MRSKIIHAIYFPGFFLALILVLSTACSKTEPHTEKITVRLTTDNRSENKVSIKGLFNLWERSELDAKDASGVILIQKPTEVPELLYLSSPISFENFWCFLEPGDSINIHVDGEQLVFSGDSLAVAQNYLLQQIIKERSKILENKKELILYNKNRESGSETEKPVVPTYNEIFNNTERLIGDFKKRVPKHSSAFMRFVEIDHKYYRIQNDIGLKIRQSHTYENYSEDNLKLLSETLEDSKIDETIYSGYYRRVLNAYIDYLRIHDPKQLLGDGKEYILNELRLADYVESPLIRNYVAAHNLLLLVFRENLNPEYIEAIENYGGRWKDFLHNQVQSTQRDTSDSAIQFNEFPEFQAVNVNGDSVRLSDFRGNWIYLEVWTTWSGLSNFESSFYRELENRLQDYPVEFVRVSVDNIGDKDKWNDYIQKYRPIGTYLFCTQKKQLYSELGITAVPHFSIINPEGKLVLGNAPRPSSGIPERLLKALASE